MSNENSKLDAERALFQAYLDDCREHDIEPNTAGAFRFALQANSLPVGVPEGAIYVECRQCDQCQHGGINDAAAGLAACHDCDWTGPEPVEDKCPGCHREDCMAAACPKCGSRYVLVASEDIAAPAAPAVKAEQVQCDTCHGQGEICVGQQTFGYMSMQPPEPIMEVCPECGGEEAPSLPAAGAAGEEVEVVGWLGGNGLHAEENMASGAPFPLMTVAQHERIVAQLVGGDSVSVPRELLETLMGDNPMDAWDARKELRALLASHAEGGKV